MPQPETPAPDPAPGVITLGRAGKKTTIGGRTRVIVPLTGDAASLRSQVAALASADIAEWRADTFLASLVGSHFVAAADIQSELTSAARYVTDASPVPVLATIRTFVEGGHAYLDDEEYCALVRCLAPLVGPSTWRYPGTEPPRSSRMLMGPVRSRLLPSTTSRPRPRTRFWPRFWRP